MGTRPRRAPARALLVLLAAVAVGLILAPGALAQSRATAVNPFAQLAVQQAVLIAGDGAWMDWFGYSVAIDGDTAVVGAMAKNVNGNASQGAAYIFTRSGASWSQRAELTAADGGSPDQFGFAVALQGDTALIGAPMHTVDDSDYQGSAYVFQGEGSSWMQTGELTGSGGATNDFFGRSVALSGDTALVGAPYKKVGTNGWQGAAYVFARSGTLWSQQAEFPAPDGAAEDQFGTCAALDGDTAILGAPGHEVGGTVAQGAAFVFARHGTTWTLQAELTGSDGAASDEFGKSVALDGDDALVGAFSKKVNGNNQQGAVYAFTRSGTLWSQQAELVAGDGQVEDQFGSSVALDGDTALIGAFWAAVGGIQERGAAYIFTRSGAAWSQRQKLTQADGIAGDEFGWCVALDAKTALVGSEGWTVNGNAGQGAVFAYVLPCTVTPGVVGGGGTISPNAAQTLAWGATPTFAFAPDAGYLVAQVMVDGAAVTMTGADSYTFPALTADHTISVAFAAVLPAPTPKPVIGKLSAKSGARGTTVTIRGTGFGATRGAGVVKFGKAKVGKYVSWSATRIKVKVPKKAKHGLNKVTLTTAGGTSAAKNFKVQR